MALLLMQIILKETLIHGNKLHRVYEFTFSNIKKNFYPPPPPRFYRKRVKKIQHISPLIIYSQTNHK